MSLQVLHIVLFTRVLCWFWVFCEGKWGRQNKSKAESGMEYGVWTWKMKGGRMESEAYIYLPNNIKHVCQLFTHHRYDVKKSCQSQKEKEKLGHIALNSHLA